MGGFLTDDNGRRLPPSDVIVLSLFKKRPKEWMAIHEVSHRTGIGIRTVSDAVLKLIRSDKLLRKKCPCGAGWVHKLA